MKTIVLSTKEEIGNKFTYYLSKATKEQCDAIDIVKGKEETNKKLKEIVGNPDALLVFEGDGMKLQSYRIEPVLDHIANGNLRCYDMSLEQQEETSSLVAVCTDTKTCWQSALRKIGYKQASGLNTPAYYEAYCLIWKTID